MIALVATAMASPIAVSDDRVAVLLGDEVAVIALDDGRPLARWPTGRYRPEHVGFSGDRLAAWGSAGTLVWGRERLEVATSYPMRGPATPLGEGLLLELSPWAPMWVDLARFDTQEFPDVKTGIGEAELDRCVPLADEAHVACGGDPGPTCAGTLRDWTGAAVPLGLCAPWAAAPDGLLGRDVTGAWAWRADDGHVAPLPDLPPDALVAVGPTAFVALRESDVLVVPRDGSAPRALPLPLDGSPPSVAGGVIVGGIFGAVRLDVATGAVLASYPAAKETNNAPPPYAGVATHRDVPFERGAGRLLAGPGRWIVSPRPDGVEVRRGAFLRRDLRGRLRAVDADGRLLLLLEEGVRDRLVAMRPGGVRWRRALPGSAFQDARFVDGALIVALGAGVARLDPDTGEVMWVVKSPFGARWVLTED